MSTTTQAFIFDLNGTMIDDMNYHAIVWNDILNNELHAGLTPEQVKAQMYGKNEELMERVFGKGTLTPADLDKWSMEKELRYQALYLPHLALVNGLKQLLDKAAAQNILLAIGSAAIPFNIDFVLDNLHIRHYFKTIVSADDVKIAKPHPEVFLLCAEKLGVPPGDCIVFEDAPKGVESAQNAGMRSVAITTTHEQKDFLSYSNIIGFIKDFTDPALDKLFTGVTSVPQST
ncbi:HAD family hydrolase [Chitinophagaceae bacterium MMS25-I14]